MEYLPVLNYNKDLLHKISLYNCVYTQYLHQCYVKELYEHLQIFSPEQLNAKTIAKQLDVKLFYWEEKSQAIIYDDMSAIFIDLRNSIERHWQDF